jgi:RNA polymerase sigma factor (sigma-70 family)
MYFMQTHLTLNKPPSELTDDALVQQAQIGDQGAFEVLVDRYSPLLLPMISHMLRDEYLAHDILQHVFLQLYRSLPTLRAGEGTLKAWLSQVARHRCIDELRRKRPFFFSEIASISDEDEFSFLATLRDPDQLPEQQAELHELQQQLLKAIEMLPLRFRAIVWLRYTTQLSFCEIGQALSIPEATAKTYFYRARKPLRTLLEPEFAHDRGTQSY